MCTHRAFQLTVVIDSFSDVVYLARIPDRLLDQGSKKSSSLLLLLDSPLDKEDACEKGKSFFLKEKKEKKTEEET